MNSSGGPNKKEETPVSVGNFGKTYYQETEEGEKIRMIYVSGKLLATSPSADARANAYIFREK